MPSPATRAERRRHLFRLGYSTRPTLARLWLPIAFGAALAYASDVAVVVDVSGTMGRYGKWQPDVLTAPNPPRRSGPRQRTRRSAQMPSMMVWRRRSILHSTTSTQHLNPSAGDDAHMPGPGLIRLREEANKRFKIRRRGRMDTKQNQPGRIERGLGPQCKLPEIFVEGQDQARFQFGQSVPARDGLWRK